MRDYPEILFELRGGLATVTLNRAPALNALTLEMVRLLDARLVEWAADPAVRAILVEGAGERAFCAGGDVRALYEAGKAGGDLPAEFYAAEYAMNHRIHRLDKPYVALMDGITMGGGVGVSVHGSHRVVTEHTVFAMPETGIGLFPDVGGGYFLPRLPGALGMYLGLTGARLEAADCLYAGIATHYVASGRLGALKDALARADWQADARAIDRTLNGLHEGPGAAPLAAHRQAIDRCFAAETVADIIGELEAQNTDWAARQLEILAAKSPTSLKLAFRQIREGAKMSFAEVMRMEYRLTQGCMAGHDFYEGVRAAVIDKDRAPKWRPARLDQVTDAAVDAYFAPLGERDLVLC
ncbi:MAG: enoyl-CoA hydratase/isomerase family protein [Kiloniellales bacterium]